MEIKDTPKGQPDSALDFPRVVDDVGQEYDPTEPIIDVVSYIFPPSGWNRVIKYSASSWNLSVNLFFVGFGYAVAKGVNWDLFSISFIDRAEGSIV